MSEITETKRYIEYYPGDESLFYVEFSKWTDSTNWEYRLFQRQYIWSEEEWSEEEWSEEEWSEEEWSEEEWKKMKRYLLSREGHPWQLHSGVINMREGAVDLETKEFLKYLVDALNEKAAKGA